MPVNCEWGNVDCGYFFLLCSFGLFLMISNWFRGSSCFCESETDRRIVRCVCAARAAVVCPSGFLSHCEAATRIHTHGAHGLQRARRKERKALPSGALYFLPGRGGEWGWGGPERTVRICESRERRREGGKAKNERNRKTSNRKTFIGQARKQSKKRSCCGVVMGVHRRAPVAHFHVCYSERGHTRF